MGKAFARECTKLLRQKRRPLVFADTANEADHLLRVLTAEGLKPRSWQEVRLSLGARLELHTA